VIFKVRKYFTKKLPKFKLGNRVTFFLIGIAWIYFTLLITIVPKIEPIWKNFWDTNDYYHQSQSNLFTENFFAPTPKRWFTPRPFTMPLLYKIAGSDCYRMFFFQKQLYCVCILLLIIVLCKLTFNNLSRLLFSLFFLFFFTWWSILGWSNNLLSEFTSTIFLFLWIATVIYYYLKQSPLSIFFLFIVSVLFSFSRDNWAYILLSFFIINVIINFKAEIKKKIGALVLLILFIGVFFVQNYTILRGERHVLPIYNSIAVRISQNDAYLNWFKKEGMPDAELMKKHFAGININTLEGQLRVMESYSTAPFKGVLYWVKCYGKNAYQKFILTHPGYFFLTDQKSEEIDRILTCEPGYYQKPRDFFANADVFFPFFGNIFFFISVLSCFYIWIKEKNTIYLLPLFFSFLFFLNALIVYNADTMEVERHLYTTVICREFISMFSLFLIVNYFLERRKLLLNKV